MAVAGIVDVGILEEESGVADLEEQAQVYDGAGGVQDDVVGKELFERVAHDSGDAPCGAGSVDAPGQDVYSQTAIAAIVNTEVSCEAEFQMGMRTWLGLLLLLLLAAVSMRLAPVTADPVDDEYAQRLKGLAADDVRGHLALAQWCREQSRWELVARVCHKVKRLEPSNRKAKLLLELARTHLNKQQTGSGTTAGGAGKSGGGRASGGKLPRVLTDAEVQRIRRAELYPDDRERARIRIDRGAQQEFFESMSGNARFPYDRRTFFALPPAEKAEIMLRLGEPKYAEKITVTTDPERMRVFVRKVMPVLAVGCATVECHGGASESRLQLYGGRTLKTNVAYANFLTLHEYQVDKHRLIDRNSPEQSLILAFGLPPRSSADGLNHPVPIEPVYKDREDRGYQTVYEWLSSLSLKPPEYGVDPSAAAKP